MPWAFNRGSPMIRDARPLPAVRLFLSPAVLVAALLAPAPAASAQGTSGTMPQPITSLELVRYEDYLQLAPEQRQAAEGFHDEYKQRFQALRDGEIARFLDAMRAMRQAGLPGRAAFDSFMDKMEQAQGRIRSLDDAFFSQLETLLDDARRPAIEHLRLSRARERYRSDTAVGIPPGVVPQADLSEIITGV